MPGYYVVGLRVGCGSRSGYDVAAVAASYDEPLVPLDTISYAQAPPPPPGVWGVKVAGDFYAWKGDAVQVVVLDRATLGLVANTGYQATAQSFDAMQAYFKSLPSSDLVIVTHSGTESQAPLPSDSLPDLDAALHMIGGSLPARWTLSTPNCWSGATDQCGQYASQPGQAYKPIWQRGDYDGGSFSVIGVPGLAQGQAWRATALQSGARDGANRRLLHAGNRSGQRQRLHGDQRWTRPVRGGRYLRPPNCDVQIGYPADPQLGLPASPHFATYPSPGPNGMQVLELTARRSRRSSTAP